MQLLAKPNQIQNDKNSFHHCVYCDSDSLRTSGKHFMQICFAQSKDITEMEDYRNKQLDNDISFPQIEQS